MCMKILHGNEVLYITLTLDSILPHNFFKLFINDHNANVDYQFKTFAMKQEDRSIFMFNH